MIHHQNYDHLLQYERDRQIILLKHHKVLQLIYKLLKEAGIREIRVIDNTDSYDVFYKLYTYSDPRYEYRIKDLPASINPTSAAIMLNEVKEFLNKDAKVLDPFCGTSTMLIERNHISKVQMYGTDINAKAIEYSYINSKNAGVNIELYNINCLEHIGYYDMEKDELIVK